MYVKKIIFIFIIYTTTLIAAQNNIILSAKGYANTPEQAKKNALQELIFQIQSDIKTSFHSTLHIERSQVKKQSSDIIDIKSKGFFQNLYYSDVLKKNNTYEVEVYLTNDALKTTLQMLSKIILIPSDILNINQKKDHLEKINIFYSLLTYANTFILQNIPLQKIKHQEITLYKSLNFAKIIFSTNIKNTKLNIKNKIYKENIPFYLSEGNYKFTIYKDGYGVENGTFYAKKGSTVSLYKSLIKINTYPITIYINSSKKNLYKDIQKILTKYHINYTNNINATNAFIFSFHQTFLTKIGETTFYTITLTGKAYKGNKLYLTKTATIKRVTIKKIAQNTHKLIKALTKALLQDINIKDFIYDKKVNYEF